MLSHSVTSFSLKGLNRKIRLNPRRRSFLSAYRIQNFTGSLSARGYKSYDLQDPDADPDYLRQAILDLPSADSAAMRKLTRLLRRQVFKERGCLEFVLMREWSHYPVGMWKYVPYWMPRVTYETLYCDAKPWNLRFRKKSTQQ